jgi:hypothetical protein
MDVLTQDFVPEEAVLIRRTDEEKARFGGSMVCVFQVNEADLEVSIADLCGIEWEVRIVVAVKSRELVKAKVRLQWGWYTTEVVTPEMSVSKRTRDVQSIHWDIIAEEIGKALSNV